VERCWSRRRPSRRLSPRDLGPHRDRLCRLHRVRCRREPPTLRAIQGALVGRRAVGARAPGDPTREWREQARRIDRADELLRAPRLLRLGEPSAAGRLARDARPGVEPGGHRCERRDAGERGGARDRRRECRRPRRHGHPQTPSDDPERRPDATRRRDRDPPADQRRDLDRRRAALRRDRDPGGRRHARTVG
jgi:hypothetical protein